MSGVGRGVLACIGLLLSAVPQTAVAQGPEVTDSTAPFVLPALEVDSLTLPNGLRVLVHPDASDPVVTVSLWVHAGRALDPRGGGLAHLVEHLYAFESDGFGPGVAARAVAEVGGRSDSTSDFDRTAFTEVVPADAIDIALDVQASRLAGPAFSAETWSSTREALGNELTALAQQPYSLEQMVADTLATRSGVYRAALAWRDRIPELAELRSEDVRDFAERWFGPANAVLVVAGDVPVDVLDRIRSTFGGLGGGTPTSALAEEPVPDGPRRVVLPSGFGGPMLWISYGIPAAAELERRPLEVLTSALTDGPRSLLSRRLIDEQGLATGLFASIDVRRGPGTITLGIPLNPAVDPDLAESLIVPIIESVAAEGIEAIDIARAKRRRVSEAIRGRLTTSDKALVLQRWQLYGPSWAPDDEIRAIESVGELDLVRASSFYLVPERRATVRLVPGDGVGR